MTKLLLINFCTEQTAQTPNALLQQEDKEKHRALLFTMSANLWPRFLPTEESMGRQSNRYSDLSAGSNNNPSSTLCCWCRTRPPDTERGYECSKHAVEEKGQSFNLGAGQRTRANSLYNVSNGGQIWYWNLECLQRIFSVTQKLNSVACVRERTIPSDRRLSVKWLPTFADRGCHVVSVTDL
jgi:hypothetical protein